MVVNFPAQVPYGTSTSAVLQQTITSARASTAAPGSGQSVGYGLEFGEPLVAVVTDSHGYPVPGATVTFSGNGGLILSSRTLPHIMKKADAQTSR